MNPTRDRSLRIALVVPGRFHAFELAKALTQLGHEVVVFTNYSKGEASRFGLRDDQVRSFWIHRLLTRGLDRTVPVIARALEPTLHRLFGIWAARQLEDVHWDIIHCWSGISEELLQNANLGDSARWLMRGSTHIETQARLLNEESARVGVTIDRPSRWMIEREKREYKLADRIAVLSVFSLESFLSEGLTRDRMLCIPLGTDHAIFRPTADTLAARSRRIRAGEPLRILFVGALSYRKGALDLLHIARALDPERFRLRIVGPITHECQSIAKDLRSNAEVIGKVPQWELPEHYAWADIFIFPTIEDGYPVVVAQAQAAGVPIIATTNCNSTELVREGQNGWIVPIRSPDAFLKRIESCEQDRIGFDAQANRAASKIMSPDWIDVAASFVGLFRR